MLRIFYLDLLTLFMQETDYHYQQHLSLATTVSSQFATTVLLDLQQKIQRNFHYSYHEILF